MGEGNYSNTIYIRGEGAKYTWGGKDSIQGKDYSKFDISSLGDAEEAGAFDVRIIDGESGFVYMATIEDIRNNGFKFERGWGRQIALHIDEWFVEYWGRPSLLGLL